MNPSFEETLIVEADRGAHGDETFMRLVINLPQIYAAQNF
jgi:hypothetical protein